MSKRDVFIRVFQDSQRSLSAVDKLTKNVARDIQFLQDLGECVESLIDRMPNENILAPEEWDELTGTWRRVRDQTQSFEKELGSRVGSLSAVASGTGLTMTSVFQVVTVSPVEYDRSILKKPIEELYRLFDNDALSAEIRNLIIQFGLDTRAGSNRSPLELFEDATAALERPSTEESPVATTIPLRECIDQIIDQLLKRRHRQEPTGKRKAKILSIGNQCGKDGLPPDHFIQMGDDAESVQNELSGTKPVALARQDLIRLFQRGALFIKSFLTSIDASKLKL